MFTVFDVAGWGILLALFVRHQQQREQGLRLLARMSRISVFSGCVRWPCTSLLAHCSERDPR